jgi:hypothetical protein
LKAPAGGFSDPKLSDLFFPPKKADTPTSTASAGGSSGPSSSSAKPAKTVSGGAIAGGVIGGLALLGLIVFLASFLIWRHRRYNSQSTDAGENEKYVEPIHELAGKHDYSELGSQQYAELNGSKPGYELAATTQHYELPTEKESSRVNSRRNSGELARSPSSV